MNPLWRVAIGFMVLLASDAELLAQKLVVNTLGEADHWWFAKGTPIRRVAGRTENVKQGEKWTRK